MFLRKMILADQIFDDTYDATIDSLVANVEALACTKKRSMVLHYNEASA